MMPREFLGSWRAALRVARRSAWRHRRRNALILLMLFVPAYAATVLVAAWSNLGGSSPQSADYQLGRADMEISAGSADGLDTLAATLPPGSHTLSLATGTTVVRTPAGLGVYEYEAVDAGAALVKGRYVVADGRAPRTAGEVALTGAMADLLGVGPGDEVTAGVPQRRLTVVGIVHMGRSLRLPAVVVPVGAELSGDPRRFLLVDLPKGVGWSAPPSLWGLGPGTLDRRDIGPTASERAVQWAGAMLVICVAAAQVVLLVGAAFAVGARRQRRELALIVAVGASRRQVSRVVLAGGLVLGSVAAAAGAVLGPLTFSLAGPIVERVADHPLLGATLPSWRIAGVAALTVLVGMLAAALPARGAGHGPVRAELGGVRAMSRADIGWLLCGLTLAGLGTAVLISAARPDGRAELIAAGAIAQLLGAAASAPAVVRLVGSIAGALPMSGRIAVRHAARHRFRTGAAVAAVAAAVAGSVALTLVYAARGEAEPARPAARAGQVLLPPEATEMLGAGVIDRVAAALPTRRVVSLRLATALASGDPSARDESGTTTAAMEQRGIAVGGVEVVELMTGRAATADEARALRDGRAIVFNDTLERDGRVVLRRQDNAMASDLPAVVVVRGRYYTDLPGVLVSVETAARLGIESQAGHTVVDTVRMPRIREVEAATTVLLRAQIDAANPPGDLILLRVADDGRAAAKDTSTMFYVLGVVSLLVTAVASLVAVGLAGSELRADLATMVAVGATPRTRRRMSAAQAGVVVGLGAPLGLLAGLGPAAGYVAYRVDVDWRTPWSALLLLVVVPPVVAMALAGVMPQSRLPLIRRMT